MSNSAPTIYRRLLLIYRPPRLFFGALWRIVITGKPAPWHLAKIETGGK